MYIYIYIERERERVFVKSRNITAIDIYKLCVMQAPGIYSLYTLSKR